MNRLFTEESTNPFEIEKSPLHCRRGLSLDGSYDFHLFIAGRVALNH